MMVSDHSVTCFKTNASAKTSLTALLAALFAALILLFAPAQHALANTQGTDIASGTSGTCSWIIDANGKLTVAPLGGDSGALGNWTNANGVPWYANRSQITSVSIRGSITATTCACLFANCAQLTAVDLSGLDTSNVNNMAWAFANCSSLVSANLSSLDASNATNTSSMFQGCTSLEFVVLPQSPMGALEAAAYMFRDCESLTHIDLSSFVTAHPKELQDMFDTCRSLETLDLSPLDMSNAKFARYMLYRCNNLKTVYVSSTWSISTCDALDMLWGCTSLVGANGTTYDPEHTDGEYARVDTEETPGYFWLANDSQGPSESTDDPDNPSNPDDPDNPANPNTGGANSPAPLQPAATGTSSSSSTAASAISKTSKGTSATPKSKTSKKSLKKAKVKLSKTSLPYTGKAQKPKATVKLGGKKLKAKRDYALVYSKGRRSIGTYKVTIKGKGAYIGKLSKTFKIVPKASAVEKLNAHKNSDGSNGFIVSWKKVKGKTGYELRWSASKKLKSSEKVRFADTSPFAKNATAPLLVRTKAWHGKKLYVQVRAFQKVKGKTYRSAWSTAKAIKLKK